MMVSVFSLLWFLYCQYVLHSRDGTRSGVPESTPAGFCVFLSDPDLDPESKICEKPDPDAESIFHFGSSRSLCGRDEQTVKFFSPSPVLIR